MWKTSIWSPEKDTTTCSSLSDIPIVSRSSIVATTSPESDKNTFQQCKLISPPSNFVENNYFRFNVCYLPLKSAFKNHLKESTLANV